MLTNEDKQWLAEHLAATEEKFSAELKEARAEFSADILAAKNDMIQVSRDMQTEVIRYMGNLAEQFSVRMRHVEANASNLDTAERLRLASLEERFLRLEKRVLGDTQ